MALIGMEFSFVFFLGGPFGVYLGKRYCWGGLIVWICTLGSSMSPCVHFLVWLVGLLVMNSVLHKLNPVRHEIFHLWNKYVSRWIVLVLIFSLLLYWRYMPDGIYSVPLLVICTRRLIHLVPMMRGSLYYCKWIFLYQVGITVCGWNTIIQICGCRLIGGEEFLIVWENLDWLLPAVIVCYIVEVESLYLHCTVLLWSGFWRFELIAMHYLLCDYLGKLIDTWCLC